VRVALGNQSERVWLTQYHTCATPRGLIRHVGGQHTLKDRGLFYVFCSNDVFAEDSLASDNSAKFKQRTHLMVRSNTCH
jgi:hypothetical protein